MKVKRYYGKSKTYKNVKSKYAYGPASVQVVKKVKRSPMKKSSSWGVSQYYTQPAKSAFVPLGPYGVRPPGSTRGRPKASNFSTQKSSNSTYKKIIGMATPALTDAAIKVGSKYIEKVLSPNRDDKRPTVPAVTENKTVRTILGMPEKIETTFNTGRPTIKAIQQQGKISGVSTHCLADSKYDFRTDELREELNFACGFNASCTKMLDKTSCLNEGEFIKYISGDTLQEYKNFEVDRYLAFKNVESQFQFYNQNSFHALQVKIYVLTAEQEQWVGAVPPPVQKVPIIDKMLQNCFSPTVTTQVASAIPVSLQYADIDLPEMSVHHSNKIEIKDADWFKQNAKVVKTFTRKLLPNQTWQFNHKHHFGSGVHLGSIIQQGREQADAMVHTYFYAIKIKGYPVEAVYCSKSQVIVDGAITEDAEQQTHLGTCPGNGMYEFRKILRYVNGPNVSNSQAGYALNSGSTWSFNVWSRTFNVKNFPTTATNKEFFVLPKDIVTTALPLVAGTASVPIETPTLRRGYETTSQEKHKDP